MNNMPENLENELYDQARAYFRILKHGCKVCKGQGFQENLENGTFRPCPSCATTYESNKKYIMSNISRSYVELDMDAIGETFTTSCFNHFQKLYENVHEFIGKANLIFHRNDDPISYGTSTAGILMVKKLIDQKFTSFVVEFNKLSECFFNFESRDEKHKKLCELLVHLEHVDTLMIDGFGNEYIKQETNNQFLYSKLIAFLNNRKLSGKLTIITTDLTMNEFSKRYTESLGNYIKKEFVPFQIQCKEGKQKDTAFSKMKKALPGILDGLTGYDKKAAIITKPMAQQPVIPPEKSKVEAVYVVHKEEEIEDIPDLDSISTPHGKLSINKAPKDTLDSI